MSAIRLPSEKEINAAYDEGREAVIKMFQTTFLALAERIQELEDRLSKNSRNSGKPPPAMDTTSLRRKACGNVDHLS